MDHNLFKTKLIKWSQCLIKFTRFSELLRTETELLLDGASYMFAPLTSREQHYENYTEQEMLQYASNAPEGHLNWPLSPGCDFEHVHETSVLHMK